MERTKDADATSFEEALEASLNFKNLQQGDRLAGTVVSISGEDAYVAYGGPTEAVIAVAEVPDVRVGDSVDATVVQTSPTVRISRKLMARKASLDALRAAYENNLPVEGKIGGRNKGGFDVSVSGMRAFCPMSQMAQGKVEDPDAFIGKTFDFRIIELSEDGRKLVVSRTALLREAAAAKREELRKTLEAGAIVDGTVVRVVPFGAFVDIGGIEGLLHVSEMSRRRVQNPEELVKPGQQVRVKIMKIDEDGRRVSLSMKDQEPDPWQSIAERYPIGSSFSGRVVRHADFGIFVELEPGLDGLIHVSQLPLGIKKDDPALAVGSVVSGWIREIDPQRQRLSLAMREVAVGDPWQDAVTRYAVGTVHDGVVERAGAHGVFVRLEPGLTGLIPVSEMSLPPGGDPAKAHAVGETLKVKIISIDPDRKRIALSHEGAKQAAERNEYLEFAAQESASSEGKSAMALALEKALGKKE